MPAPKAPLRKRPKKCTFCVEKMKFIDYKNLKLIYRYLSQYGKILPKYYTGVCLRHQKKLSRAIKLARTMALLPYVKR